MDFRPKNTFPFGADEPYPAAQAAAAPKETSPAQEPQAAAGDPDAAIKEKYGKLYRVAVSVEQDDETETEFSYRFKRPTAKSYDRFMQTAAKGPTKAIRAFVLDALILEDRARLEADLEEYPGLAVALSDKLLSMLGVGNTANLTVL